MTYPGPVPNSMTSESDQRAEYDARVAAPREHVAEVTPGPRVYSRLELVDELRILSLVLYIRGIVGGPAICSQAADELARYDAECFAQRMHGAGRGSKPPDSGSGGVAGNSIG